MGIKVKTYDVKNDAGSIVGYASTWIREPDSYGDIVRRGAFLESIEKLKESGKPLPLLYNHDNYNLSNFIGTVRSMEEDEHGLKFTAEFDDTPEGQRARQLVIDGRLDKFSFAYDVLDEGHVLVNEAQVKAGYKLKVGDQIEVEEFIDEQGAWM